MKTNEYKNNPIELEAQIELIEETDELLQEVASVIEFPENKTPDLLFFTGIFVSSGENLNKSYFLPEELVKAYNTIPNKALDIEHDESEIVGHIYSCSIIDQAGNKLDIEELKNKSNDELNKMNLDILIGGILYKSRFPELAKEVKDNKWKLSMETYYQDYDIKIGSMILPRKEAEALGLVDEATFGKVARVVKNGTEVARGKVTKVLRNLLFSGCGLVKNPANPRSLILETAKKMEDKDELVIDLDDKHTDKAQDFTSPSADPGGLDGRDEIRQTSVGICVNYKKRVIDATYEGPDVKVLHENWCTLYDRACTSPSREATHPDCLRRKIIEVTKDYTKTKIEAASARDKRGNLLAELKALLKNN